eukprot:234292_1
MSSSLSETTATEYPRLTRMTRAASPTDVRELTQSAPRAVSVVNRERTHVDSEGGVREPRKTEEDFADDGDELLHLPKYHRYLAPPTFLKARIRVFNFNTASLYPIKRPPNYSL